VLAQVLQALPVLQALQPLQLPPVLPFPVLVVPAQVLPVLQPLQLLQLHPSPVLALIDYSHST